ncbi:MAG: VanW family protein [Anaerolineales bacterium]
MSRATIFFVGLVVTLLAILMALVALGPLLDGRILPGVRVWETEVGGLKPVDAAPQVSEGAGLDLPRIIILGPDGQRWAYTPRDLGLSLDLEATLGNSYAPGHDRDAWDVPLERLALMGEGRVVAPVLVWEEERARQQLRSLASQVDLEPRSAQVYLEGAEVRLEGGSWGRRLDLTDTLALLEPVLRIPGPVEVPLVLRDVEPEVTDAEAALALNVAETVLAEPLRVLVPDPQEGDPGPWMLRPEVLAQMLVVSSAEGAVRVRLAEGALLEFLQPMAAALHREAVDAKFHFDMASGELVPVAGSEVGRALDLQATVARINEQLLIGQHHVPLIVVDVPPQYPETATAADLGIIEEVAVGESYFIGSSSARDHNIRLGASKFDGVIVAPGETFSFNEHLGEVTLDEGYDESYVIIGDRTVPGVGGGICQVATTAFRAAYYGGYQIVERWPHAYRVGYYELGGYGPGFDATIYSPLVDFRFVNDTQHHLLIHTEVDGSRSRLRFVFYGTRDGRSVEQIGPTWGDALPPGAPVYEYDPHMASGTVVKLESAHEGLEAVLERVVRDAGGGTLHQDRFVSNFVPWSARYRFGPGFQPPAGAEVVGLGEQP